MFDLLDPRDRKTIFVGFNSDVNDFKLWDPKDKNVVIIKDITFDEAPMIDSSQVRWRLDKPMLVRIYNM